ncbi:hydrogenase maturation protease [Mycobacterium sp. CVI_P3]|uniref:Hydrogenase maturation protease n=1 Tax=Mycobacterium pinniadriaticum TaxID=2994102 RepID=A0ABT3SCL1_9MYCO|nr:hydrogenase maturation protease [Mycobacterium pinniadriaticum]MCX2930821.1 hydrogenase maturation protease [Mycobacterium pinniadriaticum]MCX2937245.1 hydrogenase maturation protease [Mycobacterium pinniadriaticum]
MNEPAEMLRLPADLLGSPDTLVYGIGNCGRQDDGLGWAFIDQLEGDCRKTGAGLRRTYQLNLEDADLINRFSRVLFVDATKDRSVESFAISRPEPVLDLTFTSHALSVPSILATARQCFGRIPEAYLLAIRGYHWELSEGLTSHARDNLNQALHFVSPLPASVRSG